MLQPWTPPTSPGPGGWCKGPLCNGGREVLMPSTLMASQKDSANQNYSFFISIINKFSIVIINYPVKYENIPFISNLFTYGTIHFIPMNFLWLGFNYFVRINPLAFQFGPCDSNV